MTERGNEMHGKILAAVFLTCTVSTNAVGQPAPKCTSQFDESGHIIISSTDPCPGHQNTTSSTPPDTPAKPTDPPVNASTDPANDGDIKSATSAPAPYTGPAIPRPFTKLKPPVVAPNANAVVKKGCEKGCK
jgi:hypothetical protein